MQQPNRTLEYHSRRDVVNTFYFATLSLISRVILVTIVSIIGFCTPVSQAQVQQVPVSQPIQANSKRIVVEIPAQETSCLCDFTKDSYIMFVTGSELVAPAFIGTIKNFDWYSPGSNIYDFDNRWITQAFPCFNPDVLRHHKESDIHGDWRREVLGGLIPGGRRKLNNINDFRTEHQYDYDQIVRSVGLRRLVILIGHSWGGCAVNRVAGFLNENNLPVHLMVLLDAVQYDPRLAEDNGNPLSDPINPNVKLTLNFWQNRNADTSGVIYRIHGEPQAPKGHNAGKNIIDVDMSSRTDHYTIMVDQRVWRRIYGAIDQAIGEMIEEQSAREGGVPASCLDLPQMIQVCTNTIVTLKGNGSDFYIRDSGGDHPTYQEYGEAEAEQDKSTQWYVCHKATSTTLGDPIPKCYDEMITLQNVGTGRWLAGGKEGNDGAAWLRPKDDTHSGSDKVWRIMSPGDGGMVLGSGDRIVQVRCNNPIGFLRFGRIENKQTGDKVNFQIRNEPDSSCSWDLIPLEVLEE